MYLFIASDSLHYNILTAVNHCVSIYFCKFANLVHLEGHTNLTLCTIRMKNNPSTKCGPSACWAASENVADNIRGDDTADLHNPQKSPNPAV